MATLKLAKTAEAILALTLSELGWSNEMNSKLSIPKLENTRMVEKQRCWKL